MCKVRGSSEIALLYERPVRLLLAEALAAMPPVFSRDDVDRWFDQHYPRVKHSTIQAHIKAATVNDPNRRHFNRRVGDLLFKLPDGRYERFDPSRHGEVHGNFRRAQEGDVGLNIIAQVVFGEANDQVYHRVRAAARAVRGGQIGRGNRFRWPSLDDPEVVSIIRRLRGQADESGNNGLPDGETPASDSLLGVQTAVSDEMGIALGSGVVTLSGGVTQRFDLVSADQAVVGAVLRCDVNVAPKALWSMISELMWLLEHVERPSVRRFVVFTGSGRVPKIWLENLGRVNPDIDFFELKGTAVTDLREDM
jgi:hypothetical protein